MSEATEQVISGLEGVLALDDASHPVQARQSGVKGVRGV